MWFELSVALSPRISPFPAKSPIIFQIGPKKWNAHNATCIRLPNSSGPPYAASTCPCRVPLKRGPVRVTGESLDESWARHSGRGATVPDRTEIPRNGF